MQDGTLFDCVSGPITASDKRTARKFPASMHFVYCSATYQPPRAPLHVPGTRFGGKKLGISTLFPSC